MTPSPFDLNYQNQFTDKKIVASLERIALAFRVLLWDEGKKKSVTPLQIQILIFLLHHSAEKRRVTYLAAELNMTKATVSDAIKTLEQKELVSKDYQPHDTRSYTIQLTEKGKQIAFQSSFFTEQLELPIQQLAAQDKENLLLSLMGIIKHLYESGVITLQRMCFTCMHYTKTRDGHQHYCNLLNQALLTDDLRVDCAEHAAYANDPNLPL